MWWVFFYVPGLEVAYITSATWYWCQNPVAWPYLSARKIRQLACVSRRKRGRRIWSTQTILQHNVDYPTHWCMYYYTWNELVAITQIDPKKIMSPKLWKSDANQLAFINYHKEAFEKVSNGVIFLRENGLVCGTDVLTKILVTPII